MSEKIRKFQYSKKKTCTKTDLNLKGFVSLLTQVIHLGEDANRCSFCTL